MIIVNCSIWNIIFYQLCVYIVNFYAQLFAQNIITQRLKNLIQYKRSEGKIKSPDKTKVLIMKTQTTWKKYKIELNGKVFNHRDLNAYSAICGLCSQYGWTKGSYLVDAQTRGDICCEMHTSKGFAVCVVNE